MKKFYAFALAALIALPSYAQEAPSRGFRFYLAPSTQVSQVNGATGVLTGLQFGWLATDQFTLGFETNQLQGEIKADRPAPGGAEYVDFFYSGLTTEYAVPASARLRLGVRALIGVGEAHWRESMEDGFWGKRKKDEEHTSSFVVEPGVNAAFAINRWFQASAGVGYRYATGGKSHVIAQEDMRSFSGTLALRFGRF